jgi:hypothetical protein
VRKPDWPDELRDRIALAEGLAETGVTDATSLLFEFDDAHLKNLVKALEAPICEFVRDNNLLSVPFSTTLLERERNTS